ncbi:MAG TPA: hypothetical protein VEG24_08620 [Gaiellaceae bacterium]|nr:hypothetical protein [Gaiellaceae bacterium]
MRSTALTIAALGALVVALAGCGGGGHKSTTTTTATTNAAAAAKAAQKAATKANSTASALSGLATSANCRQLADLSSSLSAAMQGTNPNDVKKQAALLKQFADRTPSDIRPDFETLAADYTKIANAVQGLHLKQGSVPDPKALLKLEQLSKSIDMQKLATASANIGTWAQKNCKP